MVKVSTKSRQAKKSIAFQNLLTAFARFPPPPVFGLFQYMLSKVLHVSIFRKKFIPCVVYIATGT